MAPHREVIAPAPWRLDDGAPFEMTCVTLSQSYGTGNRTPVRVLPNSG